MTPARRGFAPAGTPEFAAQGLRLGPVTIGGQVAPGTAFDRDRIAESFCAVHSRAVPKADHSYNGA